MVIIGEAIWNISPLEEEWHDKENASIQLEAMLKWDII